VRDAAQGQPYGSGEGGGCRGKGIWGSLAIVRIPGGKEKVLELPGTSGVKEGLGLKPNVMENPEK
jgi:hypothetical protein